MLQLPVRDHLDDVLNYLLYEEAQSAIGCLKCCKTAGESGKATARIVNVWRSSH